MSFLVQKGKILFLARLERAKQRLFPEEGGNVDTYRLLFGLLDSLERREIGGIESVEDNASDAATSFLDSSG